MTNVSHSGNNHKGARSSSRPCISCNISSVNEYDKEADLNDRPKLFLSCSSSIHSDLADDGKLGYGFTSADELEEVDIGPGDKPRPTFVSKKVRPYRRRMVGGESAWISETTTGPHQWMNTRCPLWKR
jgi:hypothetical protein